MNPTKPKSSCKGGRQRQCALSGEQAAPDSLLRFVLAPDNRILFDLRQDLPGQELWLLPKRSFVQRAIEQNLFSRLSEETICLNNLPDIVRKQLYKQALGALNLLRRSGYLIGGFEKVKQLLANGQAAVLVQASDASEAGRAKLSKLALHCHVPIIDCYLQKDLARVTGQENQVHIVLLKGGLTDKFLNETAFFTHYDRE